MRAGTGDRRQFSAGAAAQGGFTVSSDNARAWPVDAAAWPVDAQAGQRFGAVDATGWDVLRSR
jgi:hypothetical protein